MKIKYNQHDDKYNFEFKNDSEKEMFAGFLSHMADRSFDIFFDLFEEYFAEEASLNINLDKMIKKVTYHNDKATVVSWVDGDTTKSVCRDGDTFNKETGLAMCIIRKLCNNRSYNKVFEKWAH